jgi:hypothetical protein
MPRKPDKESPTNNNNKLHLNSTISRTRTPFVKALPALPLNDRPVKPVPSIVKASCAALASVACRPCLVCRCARSRRRVHVAPAPKVDYDLVPPVAEDDLDCLLSESVVVAHNSTLYYEQRVGPCLRAARVGVHSCVDAKVVK